MSINPQLTGHDQFDVLQGSVTNHFAKIESVLLQNECINGQYNLVTAASYGANCPVETPGFTRVCISTNGSIIADLENSFIEATLQYNLKYSGLKFCKDDGTANEVAKIPNIDKSGVVGDTKISKFFIGFKQSLDALERYDIYVNSQQIYSQPFVGPESTIMLAGLNDTIRENNPWVYTSYKNAATMDQNVCGVYVDLSKIKENDTFQVRIPVKINLHQFLLLSPVHYLPSFAGRWEIQLHFGSKNLIVCPVLPTVYYPVGNAIDGAGDALKFADSKLQVNGGDAAAEIRLTGSTVNDRLLEIMHHWEKKADNAHSTGWANYFTQIGMPFPVYSGVAGKKLEFKDMTISCNSSTLESCLMNTTQFQLRYEVYQALMAHYVENPLIIPTNTLSYNRFSHSSGSNATGGTNYIQATANLPVENIDSIFVLVPENERQQTCFYQPHLTGVRLGMGEFGIRPQRYMDTYNTKENAFNNRRFVSYLLDALNLENSQISAMNKDFANSILPSPIVYNADMKSEHIRAVKNYTDKLYDSSHFIIGFPCSQVGFQSGTVSSPNSNINFQFDATVNAAPDCENAIDYKASVICMFLADAELMIQVVPNSDLPLVKLSSKSIV